MDIRFGSSIKVLNHNSFSPAFKVEKEMADMVGQAEEKERRLNKSRKRLEKKLVRKFKVFTSPPPPPPDPSSRGQLCGN